MFQGRFRRADAGAIVGSDIDAVAASDAIGRLAAKSLVVHTRGDTGDSSYRLLETVRAYAVEKLNDAGESDRARDRHLDWAVGLAGELEQEMVADDCDSGSARCRLRRLTCGSGVVADRHSTR